MISEKKTGSEEKVKVQEQINFANFRAGGTFRAPTFVDILDFHKKCAKSFFFEVRWKVRLFGNLALL